MPIANIFPQFTLPGAEIAEAGKQFSDIRQNAQKLLQDKIEAEQRNKYQMGMLGIAEQKLPSEIDLQKAQAKYYAMGGGMGRGGVGLQSQMALMRQAMVDNPGIDLNKANQITSAWLDGSPTLPDGTPTPPMTGNARQLLLTVQGKNAPVAIKNQAANYDVLYNNLNDFDIEAISNFTGPKGKIKLGTAKLLMATNPNDPNIDPMARRYLTAMNESILNMDEMRKAFGTSVVPDYVYNTLGRLVNPNDSIWNDPKQVQSTYKKLVSEVKKNRDAYFEKVKHGVTATLPEQNNVSPAQSATPENTAQPEAPKEPEKKREKWTKDANGKPMLVSK